MDRYVLSRKTQEDIESIYEFGVQKFGQDQALNYLIGLRTYFQLLSENPNIGRKRNGIKSGLFSFPYASHVIFYRIYRTHIRIVRVLHGSRDLMKLLK